MPTPMSHTMQKHVQAQVGRALHEATAEFNRALTARPTQPMSTFTKTWVSEITTPQDGAREFTITIQVSEASTSTHSPTSGHGVVTR